MPFKSDAQRRLMYAVAEDPALAKEKGIPQSVAHEFINKEHAKNEAKKPKKLKKIIHDGVDAEAPAIMKKNKKD